MRKDDRQRHSRDIGMGINMQKALDVATTGLDIWLQIFQVKSNQSLSSKIVPFALEKHMITWYKTHELKICHFLF